MAYDKAADFLEPIDIAEHLDKIELYLGQVCQIAGISKMQLDYWTNKAQIPTKGHKQRIYDIDALDNLLDRLGLVRDVARSFPFPRAAGRVFTYNEFVVVARRR